MVSEHNKKRRNSLIKKEIELLNQCSGAEEQRITDKSSLKTQSHYPFYNTSPFTMAKNSPREAEVQYASLMSDPDNIDTNLETYLDGFSQNIQEIISKFKIIFYLEAGN